MKRRWDKCIEIGAPAVGPPSAALEDENENVCVAAARALGQLKDARAVEPLIAALRDSDKPVRKAAAETLVSMYKIGTLDKAHKHLILSQRDTITYHEDTHHDQGDSSSVSRHTDYHTDEGIGVDFLL